MGELKENEIICTAYAVKYYGVEYADGFVLVWQNRTRRRVPVGYYFDDTGTHIYISSFYAGLFQHKAKPKKYVLNKETKEWREWQEVIVHRHFPEKESTLENNEIEELKK